MQLCMPGSWDDTATPSVLSCCELSLLPLSTPLPPSPIQTPPAVPVRVSRIISSFLSRDVGRLRRVAFEVLGKEVSGRTCDRYLCGLFWSLYIRNLRAQYVSEPFCSNVAGWGSGV